MDLETAEIFNLTQPNQKSYDNNSMDLSLADQLKLYEALDLDAIGGADMLLMDEAAVVAPSTVGGGGGGGASANANENCGSGGTATAAATTTPSAATVGGPKPTVAMMSAAVDRSGSRTSSISNGSIKMMEHAGSVGDVGLMDGALEDDAGSLSDDTEQECKICKSPIEAPRLLSCLHGFCLACLEALMIDKTGDSRNGSIKCPVCQQATTIGSSGPSALHPDYMLTNILDLNAIEPKALNCTSCKSKDQAMSRCNDCANFLCAACDNAHKYMRCFENHTVVLLEELRGSDEKVVIHKPLFCAIHPIEMLKYYCFSCQTVACNECVVVEHKGIDHRCEQITDADKRVRTEMEELVASARSKVTACHTNVTNMHNSLTELQSQHDTARDLIESNYASFKAILDRCREKALKDLDRLHSERELNIMDSMHIVEQATERIQSTCKFASNVLQKANGPELLSLKQLITNQIHHSLQNTPKIERNYSLEFDSKLEKFEVLALDTFGRFRTESTPGPKESTPPPTLPGMPPMLQKCNTSSNGGMTGSHTASSPISMPNSMQSSFDGDMLGSNFMMPPNGISPEQQPQQQQQLQPNPNQHDLIKMREQQITNNALLGSNPPPPMIPNNVVMNGLGPVSVPNVPPSANGSNMTGLTSIAEYNLHRLANLVDNHPMSQQQQPHPHQHQHHHNNDHHMNDDVVVPSAVGNGVGMGVMPGPNAGPQFTLADLISGDQRAFSQSLQALAKFNMNGNGPQPMNRGQSPGVGNGLDNGSILSDFASLAGSTSPIGTMGDDMTNMSGMSMASSMSMAGRSKATPMQIRCKFGSLGASKAQFNSPHGFCLGVEEEIIVADTNNHRIEVFEKNGTFKFQFGVPGKEEGQLWYPRKVAVMRTTGKFVVCDRGNERSRMQIFTKNGHFMKKIAIRYIDIVAGLAVTNQGHIVAVDSVSPTVFIISEDGDLVHWFDCSDYMREPSDIAISGTDFYVCDFKGHNVAVFNENGTFQHRIGDEKITCFPNGIDISDAGDILIGDSHGNRFHVACFSREGVLQSEFECPHVKVSRCCGLKITSEGYVVTLAKNNHHVLVLNTLYIQ